MKPMFDREQSMRRCRQYRRSILQVSQQVAALHIGPAFSCLEIIDVIYFALMRKGKDQSFRDTFILSKGHGCMAQYAVLLHLGILQPEDFKNFCLPGGRLGGHPDYGMPGIAASTGSLGHGLGIAVGMCYANRLKGDDQRVYVVISDGELQEGSTWEAFSMAANLRLSNLMVFVDLNDRISLGRLSEGHPAIYPIDKKLEAFNWNVCTIDGHDQEAIFKAGTTPCADKPTLILCRTIKGKGVSYMEDQPIWHFRSPNAEEYGNALQELVDEALI